MPTSSAPEETRRRIGPVRLVITSILAVTLVILLALFLGGDLKAMEITSRSMEPTFEVGDRLFIRTDGGSDALYPGKIVVILSPTDEGAPLIKRLVALPGDRILLRGGRLLVNDKEVTFPSNQGFDPASFIDTTLCEDCYFVVGDSPGMSLDSEEFGPIPRKFIIGSPWYRYSPWAKRGRIQ